MRDFHGGWKRAFVCFAGAFWLCAVAVAQYNLASLGGSVTDSSGAPVTDAKVTARNDAIGLVRKVSTGPDGAFVVPALPVGRDTVTIEKAGFSTQIRDGIRLTVDQAASLTVTLQVGAVTQEVTVSAGAELVA